MTESADHTGPDSTGPDRKRPGYIGPRKSPGDGPSGRSHPKQRSKVSAEDVPSHFAGVTPRQPYAGRGSFDRKRPEKPSVNPRRVRGGVRTKHRAEDPPAHWVCERLQRFLEDSVPGTAMIEGRGYAEVGQARSLAIEAGGVTSSVQGRSEKPWSVEITLPQFTESEIMALVDGLAGQALFSAKLLAQELPHAIEEFALSLGLQLVPTEADQLTVRCSCGGPHAIPAHLLHQEEADAAAKEEAARLGLDPDADLDADPETGASASVEKPPTPAPANERSPDETNPDGTWCKHVACTVLLLIDRIAENPLLVFRMRGLHEDDLLSRTREQRALSGRGSESIPVYRSHVEGIESVPAHALDDLVTESPESFWDMPPEAEHLELPVSEPDVRHPLLRRLGASPFAGAKFPLVGLLATCYDVMGNYVRDLDDDESYEKAGDGTSTEASTEASLSADEPASDQPPPLPKPKKLTAKPLGKAKAKPIKKA